jgi:hypothetical protein
LGVSLGAVAIVGGRKVAVDERRKPGPALGRCSMSATAGGRAIGTIQAGFDGNAGQGGLATKNGLYALISKDRAKAGYENYQ